MRTRWLFGSFSVLVAVLSGCSDDGSSTVTTLPSASTTAGATTTVAAATTTSASGPTTTVAQDPAKAAKAKAAVIQPGDLPEGFKEQPAEDALDQDTTFREIISCLGVSANGQGSASSPTFVRGVATQMTSTVEYFATASAQPIAMAFAGSPKLDACAKEAFASDVKRNAPPGLEPGEITVARLEFPKSGLLTSAFRIKAPVGPIEITQDFIVVFNTETISRFTFLNPGQPFPSDLQQSLVAKVAGRAG
jgi:hypothetical protein